MPTAKGQRSRARSAAYREQDNGYKKRRNISIGNCQQRPVEASLNSHLRRVILQLLPNAGKYQYVRIYCHPDCQDNTCNARKGKRGAEYRHDCN